MNTVAPHPLFIRVADDLASHGWSQQNVFMPVDLTTELAKECQRFAQTADFSAEFSLQSNQSPAIARYLAIMHNLQQTFNQHLALSLTHYHSYFCCRPSSAPAFSIPSAPTAAINSVLLLNDGWLPEFAGELRLHLSAQRSHDIQPRAGTLVFFKAELSSELLAATRQHLSILGSFNT
ncbi:2OG-Fe(II) oxygenase [Thiopseudomonas alkaliphila]|uniref:Uncharacterized protein n=1 Tax=Thiopseudomonas alkaliphila TaxID=1697053 RepID=A0A0K1XEP5_9GAMM|nr:hypothetical protein [Thiopseudomonas alkaliphila]AKX59633.1 hypothetical protein AKN88_06605 [Thiopseudomonas alkaliphila]MDM1716779.1 hypothetical protein [Thiopseudomonas alkaliphila]